MSKDDDKGIGEWASLWVMLMALCKGVESSGRPRCQTGYCTGLGGWYALSWRRAYWPVITERLPQIRDAIILSRLGPASKTANQGIKEKENYKL